MLSNQIIYLVKSSMLANIVSSENIWSDFPIWYWFGREAVAYIIKTFVSYKVEMFLHLTCPLNYNCHNLIFPKFVKEPSLSKLVNGKENVTQNMVNGKENVTQNWLTERKMDFKNG